jgi:hypothetical protein
MPASHSLLLTFINGERNSLGNKRCQPLAVGFPVFFRIVDGRCTPPDFLSNLLFYLILIMMSSLQPRPGSALLSPSSAVEDVYPPPQTWIHGGWYTDPALPPGWSTDWEDWDNLRLWTATIDGKLKIDQFQYVFDVPGTIEPLAYMVSTGGLFFVFTAGGRYYYFTDGHLRVHRMEFASPQEFLQHALQEGGDHMPDLDIPLLPGTNLNWW